MKKYIKWLIPSLSVCALASVIVPAVVITTKPVHIMIDYDDYGTVLKVIDGKFTLDFVLTKEKEENEEIHATFKCIFKEKPILKINAPDDDKLNPIDGSTKKMRTGEYNVELNDKELLDENFFTLEGKFTCINSQTNKIVWTDTISRIYLKVNK